MSAAARVIRRPSGAAAHRAPRLATAGAVAARLRRGVAETGVVFQSARSSSGSDGGPAPLVRLHAPARAAAPLNGAEAGEAFALLAAVAEFAIQGMDPALRRKTFRTGSYGLETRPRSEPRLFRTLTLGIAGASAAEHEAALGAVERRLRRLGLTRLGRTKTTRGRRSGAGRLPLGKRQPRPGPGPRGPEEGRP